MTWVDSDADSIACHTSAAGDPATIPAWSVSRQADTFRYCRACGGAGCGHTSHATTPATARTAAAPAASSQPGTRPVWLDDMRWLPRRRSLIHSEPTVLRGKPGRTGRLTGRLPSLRERAADLGRPGRACAHMRRIRITLRILTKH